MVKILSQKSTDRMLGAHILGAVSIVKCAAVLVVLRVIHCATWCLYKGRFVSQNHLGLLFSSAALLPASLLCCYFGNGHSSFLLHLFYSLEMQGLFSLLQFHPYEYCQILRRTAETDSSSGSWDSWTDWGFFIAFLFFSGFLCFCRVGSLVLQSPSLGSVTDENPHSLKKAQLSFISVSQAVIFSSKWKGLVGNLKIVYLNPENIITYSLFYFQLFKYLSLAKSLQIGLIFNESKAADIIVYLRWSGYLINFLGGH